MKVETTLRKLAAVLALALLVFTGCETTDGGGSLSGSMYYGVGFYDPWYYGRYYDDVDIIVTPPDRPEAPVRPEHPIAKPTPTPRPAPMPSIPSAPRPMPRVGGGRR